MAKVVCPHCGMLFGESSIDRHIELLHEAAEEMAFFDEPDPIEWERDVLEANG